MNEPIVILLNRALPYNCVGKLTGWSGAQYGDSTFEEAFGAHVCRLPLSTWRQCKADITRGFLRPLSQWEVDFELPVEPPEAARCEMEDGKGKRDEERVEEAEAVDDGKDAMATTVGPGEGEHPTPKSDAGRAVQQAPPPKRCGGPSPTSNGRGLRTGRSQRRTRNEEPTRLRQAYGVAGATKNQEPSTRNEAERHSTS